VDVDLVAVPVALADGVRPVDLGDLRAGLQRRLIGAQAHGAAQVAAGGALHPFVALRPFGHQAYDRLLGRTEFGGGRLREAGQVPGRLDHRHLHAEADAEVRNPPLAGEAGRLDLALGPARAEAAGHEDRVRPLQAGV